MVRVMRWRSEVFPFFTALMLLAGFCLPVNSSAQSGREHEMVSTVSAWMVLHGFADVCPTFPDESARLERLDGVMVSNHHVSAKQYVLDLKSNPRWQKRQETDLQLIVKMSGGCGTDAMLEWQAGARRYVDTATQALATPDGNVVTNWPAPALQTPVLIAIEGKGTDQDGHEYLKLSLRNVSTQPLGVALSGKELRAGVCSELTSTELPLTGQTYRPTVLAHLAPGDSIRGDLKLSSDCVAFDDLALIGTVILETEIGVEYRAIANLSIKDL